MTMQNKFYILLFILVSSLGANNILTDYRMNGIYNVQKHLDNELTKVEYWNSQLKDVDTRFGYIESYSNILTISFSSVN